MKDKNIYPLNGIPLIAYSIKAALESKWIDQVVVSSDSDQILSVAEKYGATGLKRDPKLADDDTPKIIAIRESIVQAESKAQFDDVAILQANSPQITSSMIDDAYQFMLDHNLWEVMSANEDGVQNAALRIVKKRVAFQQFLSAHCGFFVADLIDVHTIEDIHELEGLM